MQDGVRSCRRSVRTVGRRARNVATAQGGVRPRYGRGQAHGSLRPELADGFVAGLLGSVDVDDGPTDEQLAILRAFVSHLWKRPDLGRSCRIRGSLAAWEGGGLVAEGEHGEGDEGFGVVEPERDPGQ